MEEYFIGKNEGVFDLSKLDPGFIEDNDYRIIHEKSVISCHDVYIECKHKGESGMKDLSRRDALMLVAPVVAMMDVGALYTGRPPSLASVNFGVASRLRSWELVWLMPYASEPSMLKL